MAKAYKNVEEMVKDLSEDRKFKESVLKEIKSKTISKFLFSLRCEYNLTQKQLSEKINCTQSKISKIESSFDKDITIKDLLDYGKVLNLQLEIGYRSRNVKVVDLIKYHVFKIKEYLDKLASLAGKDEAMIKGVFNFAGETVFNILSMIQGSVSKLKYPEKTGRPKEPVYISLPLKAGTVTKDKKILKK